MNFKPSSLKRIAILLPYECADRYTGVWAYEESAIDFQKELDRVNRATLAYAAVELKEHLQKTLSNCIIEFKSVFDDEGPHDFSFLLCIDSSLKSQNGKSCFYLKPQGGRLNITGSSREFVLWGVYEFLRIQGWYWYTPWEDGICSPPLGTWVSIQKPVTMEPSFSLIRGFEFHEAHRDSYDIVIWMARQRLNFYPDRPLTRALAQKLGIRLYSGGHIFESMLHPDTPLDSGKTIWETHPEWYGLPSSGVRVKDKAIFTTLNVTHESMYAYLKPRFFEQLKNEWAHVDILYVWGFDVWGDVCQAPESKAIGNGLDQYLYFLSRVREWLDEAYEEKLINRRLSISGCLYEGTTTLAETPTRSVPKNLQNGLDFLVYYPISRSYDRAFHDSNSISNSFYAEHLKKHLQFPYGMPLVLGEYYNLSKYEDLPLVLYPKIHQDLKEYQKQGLVGMTYMHTALCHWGVRTTTQCAYAEACWNSEGDFQEGWFTHYFQTRYPASTISFSKEIYQIHEENLSSISDYRSWAHCSLLSELILWDGKAPLKELGTKTDLGSLELILQKIDKGQYQFREAIKMMDWEILRLEEHYPDGLTTQNHWFENRNYAEYAFQMLNALYLSAHLYESIRLNNKEHQKNYFSQLSALRMTMSRTYIPAWFNGLLRSGLKIQNAWERSQLQKFYERSKSYPLR